MESRDSVLSKIFRGTFPRLSLFGKAAASSSENSPETEQEKLLRILKQLDENPSPQSLEDACVHRVSEMGDGPEVREIQRLLRSPKLSLKVKQRLSEKETIDGLRALPEDARKNIFGIFDDKHLDEACSLEALDPRYMQGLRQETQIVVSSLLANYHISLKVQNMLLHRPTLEAFDALSAQEKKQFAADLLKGSMKEGGAVGFLVRLTEKTVL